LKIGNLSTQLESETDRKWEFSSRDMLKQVP